MIIWLASYPKSGNTFVRTLLSAYFFSKEGNFDFKNLKSIKQFPSKQLFKKIGVTTNDTNEILNNYIKAQEYINERAPLILLKTHSSMFNINNNMFTDFNNTLGVIYIVRDPRNVVSSFAHHYNLDLKESSNKMISDSLLGESSDKKVFTYMFSWKNNYNSWKLFLKKKKYLLIKYENLIKKPKDELLKMLHFIFDLSNNKSSIDIQKVDNVINSTTFEKLKNLENKFGFEEKSSKMKNNFFNLGKQNKWQENLDKDIEKILISEFEEEMKELEYL